MAAKQTNIVATKEKKKDLYFEGQQRMFFHLSISQTIYQTMYLSIFHLSLSQTIYQSMYLSILHLSISQTIY